MATQLVNKWPVLGIDLVTVAVSFFIAYLIRFNFSLNFDLSKFAIQMPGVVLIALMVFLIRRSHEGTFPQTSSGEISNIFKAISILCVLIVLLMVINHQMGIFPEFRIPLSIIILFSLFSFLGLIASRYIFNALVKLLSKKSSTKSF